MRFHYHLYINTKIQSVCECVCSKTQSQSHYATKDDRELLISTSEGLGLRCEPKCLAFKIYIIKLSKSSIIKYNQMNRKHITSLYILALKIYFTIMYMCAYVYVSMWACGYPQRPEKASDPPNLALQVVVNHLI